jgi:tRNA threonylcarbamoyladenosine biosynthesis protein TsaB
LKTLYLDSTTDWIIVQIWEMESENCIYNFKKSCPREASYRIVIEIQIALNYCQITKPDCIVVAKGPGSFTGIRLAVATARNLSQLWKIPCLGLDTLEIYIDYYRLKYKDKNISVIIDGKMNKVFVRLVNGSNHSFTQDLSRDELMIQYPYLSNEDSIVYTNTNLPFHKNVNPLDSDYPDLNGSIKKINDMIVHKDLESDQYNYKNLIPNYMRGTYAN